MVDAAQIKEHFEVIGADGGQVGTVDHVEGTRIKLIKNDSGEGAHKATIIMSRSPPSST